jgi:hypothetical protein
MFVSLLCVRRSPYIASVHPIYTAALRGNKITRRQIMDVRLRVDHDTLISKSHEHDMYMDSL